MFQVAFNALAVRGFILKDISSSWAPGHYTAFCSWLVGPCVNCTSNKQSQCPLLTGCFVSAYHSVLPLTSSLNQTLRILPIYLHIIAMTKHCALSFYFCACSLATTEICSWSHYRSACFCTALYLQRHCQIIPPMVATLLFPLFPANHISYTE